MQEWDWQVRWSDIRRFLNGSNRQLTQLLLVAALQPLVLTWQLLSD